LPAACTAFYAQHVEFADQTADCSVRGHAGFAFRSAP
jgi:hypothetical protein